MADDPKDRKTLTGNAVVARSQTPSLFGEAGFGEGGFGGVGLNESYFVPEFNGHSGQMAASAAGIVATAGNADGHSEVQGEGRAVQTIELRHREMSDRIAALEKALAGIEERSPRKRKSISLIGHNNPPEAIQVPVTPRRLRKIQAARRIIAKEPARPKRIPKGAIRAAQWLKTQGVRLLKWSNDLMSSFAKTATKGAAITAGPLWGKDIHDGSVTLAKALGECLLEVSHAVQQWVNALHLYL